MMYLERIMMTNMKVRMMIVMMVKDDNDFNDVNLTFKTEVMMSKQYSAGALSSLAGSLQQNFMFLIIIIFIINFITIFIIVFIGITKRHLW